MKHITKLILVILIAAVFPTISVSAENADHIIKASPGFCSFRLEIENCTDGKNNGKITCTLTKTDPDSSYQVSFNAGKKYKDISDSYTVKNLKSGSYAIRIRKKDDRSVVSPLYTVFVGSSNDKCTVKIHTVSYGEKIYKDGKIKLYIDNYDPAKSYEYSINGGKTWRLMKKRYINITGFKGGFYNIYVRQNGRKYEFSPTIKVRVPEISSGNSKYIKTDKLLQLPELPTGCEATALTMLLNHIGFNANKEDIADNFLPKGEYRASDFNEVFVGNPRSRFAYGCFSEAIEKTARKYLQKYDKGSQWTVENISGCSTESLYSAVYKGNPVIVWATINLSSPTNGRSWTVKSSGKSVTWINGEHCMLLVGYNKAKNIIYANDPLCGIKAYDMSLFEKRFNQMGKQAIIIVKE